MQQARGEQILHHRDDPSDFHQLGHHEPAARLEICKQGDFFPDAGEVIDRQFDSGSVGDGKEVEHGVGRPAESDRDSDGVLKRLPGHDVQGTDPFLQEIQYRGSGITAVLDLVA